MCGARAPAHPPPHMLWSFPFGGLGVLLDCLWSCISLGLKCQQSLELFPDCVWVVRSLCLAILFIMICVLVLFTNL